MLYKHKFRANKNGITQQDIVDSKYNPLQLVVGVHIRLTPEGAENDKITSRVFKDVCHEVTTLSLGYTSW